MVSTYTTAYISYLSLLLLFCYCIQSNCRMVNKDFHYYQQQFAYNQGRLTPHYGWEINPHISEFVTAETRRAPSIEGPRRGLGSWEGFSQPPPHQLGGLEERCKLPQWCLGGSPSRNWIWCILIQNSGIWWRHLSDVHVCHTIGDKWLAEFDAFDSKQYAPV